MAELKEIDRWGLPKEDKGEYTRFYKIYVYEDNSLGCTCAEWKEKKHRCVHIDFSKNENKKGKFTGIRTVCHVKAKLKKGYRTTISIFDNFMVTKY